MFRLVTIAIAALLLSRFDWTWLLARPARAIEATSPGGPGWPEIAWALVQFVLPVVALPAVRRIVGGRSTAANVGLWCTLIGLNAAAALLLGIPGKLPGTLLWLPVTAAALGYPLLIMRLALQLES